MKLLDPDPLTWLTPDPGPKHSIIDYTLSFLPFFLTLYELVSSLCHALCPSSRICPDPGTGWHPGEPKELQHCQQNPQREGMTLFYNNTKVHPASANYSIINYKNTQIYIIESRGTMGFDTLILWYIFGWVKVNAALACVRACLNVLQFYQRSCCPLVDYFVSILPLLRFPQCCGFLDILVRIWILLTDPDPTTAPEPSRWQLKNKKNKNL